MNSLIEKARSYGILLNDQWRQKLFILPASLEGGELMERSELFLKPRVDAAILVLGQQCPTHFPAVKHAKIFF